MRKRSFLLVVLFYSKYPYHVALDHGNQASSLPAFVERAVELLISVAEFGVGFEDNRTVVEELDANIGRFSVAAVIKDVAEWM